jgi:hypothetical protein
MAKYRKKPVTIEAKQWTGKNIDEIDKFINCGGYSYSCGELKINTLEGKMLASKGDYIIKGVNNEFYPCKSDIFAKTYEKVEK